MQVNWGDITRQQWDQLHGAAGGSLQQAWAYGEAISALGVQVLRASVRDERRQIVAVAQIAVRRLLGYLVVGSCTRGPVWVRRDVDHSAVYRAVRKAFRLPGLRVLLWTPEFDTPDADQAGVTRVMTGMGTVMLDLSVQESVLRKQLSGNWRNRLVKAEREQGLGVFLNSARGPCDQLLRHEMEQRKVRGFAGLPVGFVRQYIDAFKDPDRAFLIARVERQGEMLAGMLFLLHGSRATYHIGWSGEAARDLNLHNLLMWRAMLELKRRQILWLDLGGVNTAALPGISRFKIGTGGVLTILKGTYLST